MGKIGFTDVHCHILPKVDDGSKSEEMTREMIKTAYEQGVRRMIATPHFTGGSKSNPSKERISEAYEKTVKIAHEIDKDFEICLGNELYYEPGIHEDLQEGRANHMAGTRYVLVEFSPGDSYQRIYEAVREFTLHGDIPIIAHIERYECVHKREDRFRELVELGGYIQVNVSSLVGGIFDSDAKFLRKMLNQRLVHFLGTDCHNSEYRVCKMGECVNAIEKKVDSEYLDKVLYEHVALLLQDKYL